MAAVVSLLIALLMQLSAPTSRPNPPTACIITIGPGDQSWEKFGHNMLEIRDPDRGFDDVAFNWGIFDFDAPNFYLNFLRGKLWYSMGGTRDAQKAIDSYRDADRTIWVQELNLSPAQVDALLDLCLWNAQKENRDYRYDYFLDNCSTRVRDAVDRVLGDQIKHQASTQPSSVTYRSETDRLMADDAFLYIALNYVLGQPTDRKLSGLEEMFIPMRLRERMNHITITDPTGKQMPLVRREIVLNTSKHISVRDEPPNWVGWFLLAGMIIGGCIAAGGLALARSREIAKPQAAAKPRFIYWSFVLVAISWSLLAGFAGWFLLYAWFGTDHLATHPNENLWQLSPLALPLVILWPLSLRRTTPWAAKTACLLAAMALASSFLGLILKVLPMMDQVNMNMIALALPANFGLAWAAYALNIKRDTT